jgi:hypothetical protein
MNRSISIAVAFLALLTCQHTVIAQGWNVEQLGTLYDFWNAVDDIAVQGQYAYIATGSTGLRIADISDLSAIVEVGVCLTPYDAWSVAVEGNYAYVADYNAGLRVIDVTDPSNPDEVGFLSIPGYARNVTVEGNYVYIVGNSDADFRIVDVTDPTNPQQVGMCDVLGDDIWISANYAYVVSWSSFSVIDISDPANPYQTGYLSGYVYLENVAVYGSYAYLTHYLGNVIVMDVSNPASPYEAASLETGWYNLGIDIAGGYANVGSFGQGLLVLDLADPVNPVQVGVSDVTGVGLVTVSESYAYVSLSGVGMGAIDISTPSNPTLSGQLDRVGLLYHVDVSGDYAYLAASGKGLRILDVSDPENPFETGFCDSAVVAWAVDVQGNYAFVADNAGALRIYDVSDPYNPFETGACVIPDEGCDVEVQGDYAYVVADNEGLRIVEITDPYNPTEVGVYENASCLNIAVSGDYAYLTAYCYDNNATIIDISDPTNPTMVSFYHDANLWGITVSEDYAYVCGLSMGLRIFYVGAGTFAQQGVCNTPGSAKDVAISENFAFVADGYGGLRVIDVSTPYDPFETGYYYTPDYTVAVAVNGDYAYVADELTFGIYDCSSAMSQLTVNLIPMNPPIIIPENGGSFEFNIAVENNTSQPQTFDIWTVIELPGGGEVEILNVQDVTIAAATTIDRDRTQIVPPNAPAGTYTYYAFIGDYPQQIDHSDFFTFEKQGVGNMVSGASSLWTSTGEEFGRLPVETHVDIEDQPVTVSVNPNPFNPLTVLSYRLQDASRVNLSVYDVSGRKVAELVNGWREAGTHEVTFDATNLASGIYIYRLAADNHANHGKMILLK